MRSWAHQTAGGLPRAFWCAWGTQVVNRAGAMVLFLLAFYLAGERHLGAAAIGLVLSVAGLGSMAGMLAGGHFCDHWGRRPALLGGLLGNALAVLALGWLTPLPLLVAASAAVGFTRGLYEPALGAVTADVVPAPDRVRAFSLLYWAQNLATGVAALGGGLLAVFDLRLVFAADALTSLAAAVLVVATIPETRPDDVPRHIAAAPLTPWRDAAFLSLCATGLLVGLVFGQHLSGLSLSMSADGLPARAYGLVIALNTAMIGAVQLLAPKLLAGRDPSRVLAATALTAGVGFGLSGLADSTWGYAGSVVVWTAAEICMAPSTSALIAALAPATARGRYQGLYGLAGGAGFALAPVLGGALLAGFGAGALWFGCVVAGLVAATIHLLSAPIRRRRLLPAGSGG